MGHAGAALPHHAMVVSFKLAIFQYAQGWHPGCLQDQHEDP
jgi:hypothetical protein